MNLFEQQRRIVQENLQRTYGHNELSKALEGEELQKGKKANIGEIREWGGHKYKKEASGWKMSESIHQGGKKASENIKQEAEEKKKNPFHGSEVKEEDGKFYLKRGDYYLNSDSKDTVNKKNAVSFPSKEALYQAMGAHAPKSS